MLRKHGPTTTELAACTQVWKRLSTLTSAADRASELEKEQSTRLARASTAARALSKSRREAADRLADAIGRELASLGMGRAKVVVDVAPTQTVGEGLSVDGARLQRVGRD